MWLVLGVFRMGVLLPHVLKNTQGWCLHPHRESTTPPGTRLDKIGLPALSTFLGRACGGGGMKSVVAYLQLYWRVRVRDPQPYCRPVFKSDSVSGDLKFLYREGSTGKHLP